MTLSSELTIPARVVIGVTGHRKLDNETVLAQGIDSATFVLSVLSPLAEGADRQTFSSRANPLFPEMRRS
jgi:hypothetical protein